MYTYHIYHVLYICTPNCFSRCRVVLGSASHIYIFIYMNIYVHISYISCIIYIHTKLLQQMSRGSGQRVTYIHIYMYINIYVHISYISCIICIRTKLLQQMSRGSGQRVTTRLSASAVCCTCVAFAVYFNVLQCFAMCCNLSPCVAMCCTCVAFAVCCRVL